MVGSTYGNIFYCVDGNQNGGILVISIVTDNGSISGVNIGGIVEGEFVIDFNVAIV